MELSKEFVERLSEIFFTEQSVEDSLRQDVMQMSLEKNQDITG